MMSTIRVGTSGWSYPAGRGTWNGVFYPPRRGRAKNFDELSYYAEHFDTVEVNSTFYGQPRAEVASGWADRTPDGFEFAVKLYQKFTHPRMFRERVARSLPSDIEAPAAMPSRGQLNPRRGISERSRWGWGPSASENMQADAKAVIEELARPNQADLDEFRRGIEPLAAAGKLGALLAQFPPSFKNGAKERDYVSDLLRAFDDYPVAVELRHASWSDHFGETLDLLNPFQAAWVQIDEPKFRFSIRQNYLPNVKGFYYMRLHGRNAAKWWTHDKSEDRYNYLYSSDELKEFTETAAAARQIVRKTYLYTNNHFSAKSVANAAMIKQQLGEPLTGEYPPAFVEHYPELAGLVRLQSEEVADFTLRAPRTSSG
jgi:uncharacterized protein YecE (DUF72 family)